MNLILVGVCLDNILLASTNSFSISSLLNLTFSLVNSSSQDISVPVNIFIYLPFISSTPVSAEIYNIQGVNPGSCLTSGLYNAISIAELIIIVVLPFPDGAP